MSACANQEDGKGAGTEVSIEMLPPQAVSCVPLLFSYGSVLSNLLFPLNIL